MAAGRHDEDSSSQSDSTVVSVERGGAAGVVRIDLVDGSSFFVPRSVAESEGLDAGTELTPERVEHLRSLGEAELAGEKALSLLAIRDHSRFQLELKLRSRGFGSAAIAQTIVKLTERGYLDDLRFARLWIASRLRRNPEGRSRLAAGLSRAGVSRECASEALLEFSEEDEREAMERAAERLRRRRSLSADKLAASLLSKGFPVRAVRRLAGLE